MAVKNIRVDDIDKTSEATETIPFAYRGSRYAIDLCDDNVKQFDDDMAKWIHAASLIGGGKKTSTNGNGRTTTADKTEYYAAVRAWARENGHQVHDRGRLPNDVIDAYEAAK